MHATERETFRASPEAMLSVRVSAAPSEPIEEVRIVVKRGVVRTLEGSLSHPDDPFGTVGLVRLETEIPLEDLLPNNGRENSFAAVALRSSSRF